ncbi:MAG: DUF455 family protein [Deltaproteobacteria bacterium]|nr:DUF455 family protein [Deltaproteobacteria bacterium]
MTLEEFARAVLFGTTLDDKLACPDLATLAALAPSPDAKPLAEIPRQPPRPERLASFGKSEFPRLELLRDDRARGEVLHFFANHELLALELMALVLLRFPEAPHAFRLGLARTIAEEQSHLRLYLERMRELGVDFGDLPLSDYFWKTMSAVRTPLDFVVQMSLTFEQANLDFSLFFRDEIAKTGDAKTAAVLDRVYREEIGHVKHGVAWFNRWREGAPGESDWEAYRRLLPPPLTPRRAKGFGFTVEGRREAGLSETFIEELKICSGSKGRPPELWLYNPYCEAEIARGGSGFSPTGGSRRLTADLEHVPMFLALEEDAVLVSERPSAKWLGGLQDAGFALPEFVETSGAEPLAKKITSPRLGGLEPWGWSPSAFDVFSPLRERLTDASGANGAWARRLLERGDFETSGLGKLFSKAWSARFLADWLATHPETRHSFGEASDVTALVATSWDEASRRVAELLAGGGTAMLKAPFGTSGLGVREARKQEELDGPLGGWARNTLEAQGALVVERRLAKTADLSLQLVVENDRVRLLEARRFVTGSRHEYRGTYLGKKLSGLDADHLRFVHSACPAWQELARDLGARLRGDGYEGPAGIDALVWRADDGSLKLKPLVELNPRWTMGRVALALEEHLAPGVAGLWAFVPVREIKARGKGHDGAEAFARKLATRYPPKLASGRLESGVLFTNDPLSARETLTVLATLPNPELETFL